MVDKRVAQYGLAIMAVLATGVALFSFRFFGVLGGFWLDVDPGIRHVIEREPVEALTHMLIAPLALLLGPWQFFTGIRLRYLELHRWSGRMYVVACVAAGAGGIATAFQASGGPIAGFGFGLLGSLWIGATLWAWRAAVARNFPLHRLLMQFSYAMTFGAVTLRLQIPIGFALGYPSYSAMSVWLAYTAWVPNVILVALYSAIHGRSPRGRIVERRRGTDPKHPVN